MRPREVNNETCYQVPPGPQCFHPVPFAQSSLSMLSAGSRVDYFADSKANNGRCSACSSIPRNNSTRTCHIPALVGFCEQSGLPPRTFKESPTFEVPLSRMLATMSTTSPDPDMATTKTSSRRKRRVDSTTTMALAITRWRVTNQRYRIDTGSTQRRHHGTQQPPS